MANTVDRLNSRIKARFPILVAKVEPEAAGGPDRGIVQEFAISGIRTHKAADRNAALSLPDLHSDLGDDEKQRGIPRALTLSFHTDDIQHEMAIGSSIAVEQQPDFPEVLNDFNDLLKQDSRFNDYLRGQEPYFYKESFNRFKSENQDSVIKLLEKLNKVPSINNIDDFDAAFIIFMALHDFSRKYIKREQCYEANPTGGLQLKAPFVELEKAKRILKEKMNSSLIAQLQDKRYEENAEFFNEKARILLDLIEQQTNDMNTIADEISALENDSGHAEDAETRKHKISILQHRLDSIAFPAEFLVGLPNFFKKWAEHGLQNLVTKYIFQIRGLQARYCDLNHKLEELQNPQQQLDEADIVAHVNSYEVKKLLKRTIKTVDLVLTAKKQELMSEHARKVKELDAKEQLEYVLVNKPTSTKVVESKKKNHWLIKWFDKTIGNLGIYWTTFWMKLFTRSQDAVKGILKLLKPKQRSENSTHASSVSTGEEKQSLSKTDVLGLGSSKPLQSLSPEEKLGSTPMDDEMQDQELQKAVKESLTANLRQISEEVSFIDGLLDTKTRIETKLNAIEQPAVASAKNRSLATELNELLMGLEHSNLGVFGIDLIAVLWRIQQQIPENVQDISSIVLPKSCYILADEMLSTLDEGIKNPAVADFKFHFRRLLGPYLWAAIISKTGIFQLAVAETKLETILAKLALVITNAPLVGVAGVVIGEVPKGIVEKRIRELKKGLQVINANMLPDDVSAIVNKLCDVIIASYSMMNPNVKFDGATVAEYVFEILKREFFINQSAIATAIESAKEADPQNITNDDKRVALWIDELSKVILHYCPPADMNSFRELINRVFKPITTNAVTGTITTETGVVPIHEHFCHQHYDADQVEMEIINLKLKSVLPDQKLDQKEEQLQHKENESHIERIKTLLERRPCPFWIKHFKKAIGSDAQLRQLLRDCKTKDANEKKREAIEKFNSALQAAIDIVKPPVHVTLNLRSPSAVSRSSSSGSGDDASKQAVNGRQLSSPPPVSPSPVPVATVVVDPAIAAAEEKIWAACKKDNLERMKRLLSHTYKLKYTEDKCSSLDTQQKASIRDWKTFDVGSVSTGTNEISQLLKLKIPGFSKQFIDDCLVEHTSKFKVIATEATKQKRQKRLDLLRAVKAIEKTVDAKLAALQPAAAPALA